MVILKQNRMILNLKNEVITDWIVGITAKCHQG